MGRLEDDLREGAEGFVETHISWVFLTPTEAFKVKKPVELGFLDFRTLESRRRACDAEVRLNARLAPGVYRGVVPVRLLPTGRHTLGDGEEGPVVDWAVRMVRLPDSQRADCLLEAGSLDERTIGSIATAVARFHAGAACNELTASFGLPSAIAVNVRENFAQTREMIGAYLPPDQADELERWQAEMLRKRAGLFEARAHAGRVRDGHGDLRLEHVYVDPAGAITIIDCIEFNERFRFADVCADVAFLSMDLAWHGRVDLAERFLATYAREADDYDLYSVVDFYESYRAYVRAKIAAMLAADERASTSARERASAEARRYFMLALSSDRRALMAPVVVAVGGVIASGKSTVASWIAEDLSAPVVDADRTRKHMAGVAPTERLREAAWQGAYDPAFSERVYAEVLRRAGVVLDSGRPVVIDASFRSLAMRRAARELAGARGVPFRFVECRAPTDVCRARLRERERTTGVSDGRLEIFDAFCESFEPVRELPSEEHLVVDTSRPRGETLAAVEATVDVWPHGLVA